MARDKKSGPERIAEMVDVLRQWQGIERDAIETTAQIMEKTDNLLIRQIMEIIRNDSVQHHRVQQFLVDSVTKQDVALTREEVAEIWDKIQAHDEVEKQTIAMAQELRDEAWSPLHKQLLHNSGPDQAGCAGDADGGRGRSRCADPAAGLPGRHARYRDRQCHHRNGPQHSHSP